MTDKHISNLYTSNTRPRLIQKQQKYHPCFITPGFSPSSVEVDSPNSSSTRTRTMIQTKYPLHAPILGTWVRLVAFGFSRRSLHWIGRFRRVFGDGMDLYDALGFGGRVD